MRTSERKGNYQGHEKKKSNIDKILKDIRKRFEPELIEKTIKDISKKI